jgi:hypothetical protein
MMTSLCLKQRELRIQNYLKLTGIDLLKCAWICIFCYHHARPPQLVTSSQVGLSLKISGFQFLSRATGSSFVSWLQEIFLPPFQNFDIEGKSGAAQSCKREGKKVEVARVGRVSPSLSFRCCCHISLLLDVFVKASLQRIERRDYAQLVSLLRKSC